MFKKIPLAVALIFPMLASAQSLKVGLVDINAIVSQMPETQQAQSKLAEVSKRYEDEYAKLGEEMKRLYEEIQNSGENELPAIRERKVNDFQAFQAKVQQFEQTAQQDLANQQQQLMVPIYQKIQQAVAAYSQENGFNYVQVKEDQLVLYFADPVVDITNGVKAKLGL